MERKPRPKHPARRTRRLAAGLSAAAFIAAGGAMAVSHDDTASAGTGSSGQGTSNPQSAPNRESDDDGPSVDPWSQDHADDPWGATPGVPDPSGQGPSQSWSPPSHTQTQAS